MQKRKHFGTVFKSPVKNRIEIKSDINGLFTSTNKTKIKNNNNCILLIND